MNNKCINKIFEHLAIFILVIITPFVQASAFVINLPQVLKTDPFGKDVKIFFTDVYREINKKPTFIFASAERGFNLLALDKIQAEGYRVEWIGDQFGGQFKLNTPLANVKVALFCNKKEKCNVNSNLSYAVQSGFRYGEEICRSLNITCKYERTSEGIAKLLDNDLVDGVISPYPTYEKYLCLSKFNHFYFNELPRFHFELYHYTNISDLKVRAELENSFKRNKMKYANHFAAYNRLPQLNRCNKLLVESNS